MEGLERSNAAALEKMRKIYDAYVEQFRRRGVSHNDYQRYEILFDRHKSWQSKKRLLRAK